MPRVMTLSDGWAASPGARRGHVGLGAEDELATHDGVALGARSVVVVSSPSPSCRRARLVVAAAAGCGHEDQRQEHGDDAMPRCVAVLVLQDVPLAA